MVLSCSGRCTLDFAVDAFVACSIRALSVDYVSKSCLDCACVIKYSYEELTRLAETRLAQNSLNYIEMY